MQVYSDAISPDNGLVLECSVEYKSEDISDDDLDEEIRGFEEAAREMLLDFESRVSPVDYLDEYIKRCDAESEEMMAKFVKQINNTKLIAYVACGVLVLAAIVGIACSIIF